MQATEKKPEKSKRGGARPGGGRPKGVPNKFTQDFRETVKRLLEENSGNVGMWLGQVAQDDPAKALELISKLAEYAAPKLARTEIAGDPEKPMQTVIKWQSES